MHGTNPAAPDPKPFGQGPGSRLQFGMNRLDIERMANIS
jgi:hypothetical protein